MYLDFFKIPLVLNVWNSWRFSWDSNVKDRRGNGRIWINLSCIQIIWNKFDGGLDCEIEKKRITFALALLHFLSTWKQDQRRPLLRSGKRACSKAVLATLGILSPRVGRWELWLIKAKIFQIITCSTRLLPDGGSASWNLSVKVAFPSSEDPLSCEKL